MFHEDLHFGSLVPSMVVILGRGGPFKRWQYQEVTKKDELVLLDRFIIK